MQVDDVPQDPPHEAILMDPSAGSASSGSASSSDLGGPGGAPVRVEIRHDPDRCWATLTGELDLSNGEDVYRQVLQAARRSTSTVIDLSGLSFIDSAGLAVVQRLNRAVTELDVHVQFAIGDDTVVSRTLALVGMDRVLPLAPTRGPRR